MSDVGLTLGARKLKAAEFQEFDTAVSGDTSIVAGVAGKTIIVLSIFVVVGEDQTVTWKSGTTVIIGAAGLKAGGGYHIESDYGITKTVEGDALVLSLSGAFQAGGVVSYAYEKV